MEREFERLGRGAPQGLCPERARRRAKQHGSYLVGQLGSPREQFENGHHNRTRVDSIFSKLGRLIERAPPLIESEQSGARLEAERPARRQVGDRTAPACGMSEQPANAVLAEAVKQDVGERGASLPFA